MSAQGQAALAGKVALITGATLGVGRAITEGLARAGATVILLSRTPADLDRAVDRLTAEGCRAFAHVADVSRRPDVENAVRAAVSEHGPIDVLVNNAGVQGPAGTVWEVDPEEWRRVIDVNLWGTFLCCRAVLPGMIGRRGGRIINVSSGAGHSPMANYSGYSASKAAVTHFTRVLAEEAKPYGITANAVGVWGVTRLWHEVAGSGVSGGRAGRDVQSMLRAGRTPSVEENTPLFVFLASDESAHITAQYIEANSLPGCYLETSEEP